MVARHYVSSDAVYNQKDIVVHDRDALMEVGHKAILSFAVILGASRSADRPKTNS